MSGATVKKITALKEAMSKKVASVDSLSSEDVESLKDMLQQLDSMKDINLEVLTKTLIGTIVSKFKKHSEIGPKAKALVKKWKAAAKEEAAAAATGNSKSPPAAKSAKTEKAKRRDSTNAATEELKEVWYTLQPYRSTTCKKLHEVLEKAKPVLVKQGINADALERLTVERASEIEMAIQTKFTGQKQEYVGKARSLCFNLKKNTCVQSSLLF